MVQQNATKLATKMMISLSKNRKSVLTSKWPYLVGLVFVGTLFAFFFLGVNPAQALPAGFQEYFVLGNEEQAWRMFNYISNQEGGGSLPAQMDSVVTLVATADNQIIYYDHWEDGYENDLLNPTQSTTEVFGDGNLSNGSYGSTDILHAGDVLSLGSTLDSTPVVYDFSSGAGVNKWAYGNSLTLTQPTTSTTPAAEFTSTAYTQINHSDNTRYAPSAPGAGNYAAYRFRFAITQSVAAIDQINISYEGYTNNGTTIALWVWNNRTSAYEKLTQIVSNGSDATFTGLIASSIADYLDINSYLTILVDDLTANQTLRCDYVNVSVTLKGDKAQFIPVNPRGTSLRYDAGDHVLSSGGPINLAHAIWPHGQSTNGDAWEVYSRQVYQSAYSYRLPIGVDLYASDPQGTPPGNDGAFGDFKYVYLQLQAFDDNTKVSIDNGSQTINLTMNKGQTYSSMGYLDSAAAPAITINAGTKIAADKAVQVGLITGADSLYQARFAIVLPYLMWGPEYVAPVPRTTSGNPAQVYIYNPNDHAISVTAYDAAGSGTFSIPGNVMGSTVAYNQPGVMNRYVPENSAVRLVSNDPFNIFIAADTSNTSYDWSLSGIPAKYMTSDYYVSWSPGSDRRPPTENGSPVWVTPLANNTTFYVDYGPVDGKVDQTFTLNTLEQRRIFDPDNDNTGMHIWATGKFAAAWGEDPATAGAGTPYLDLGYTILPLYQGWLDPVLILDKTASPEILPFAGGAVTFNLQVKTNAPAPVTNLKITDTLPLSWTYRAGTTHITYPDGSTATPDPSINGRYLFWNLGQQMDANQTLNVQFQAEIQTGGKVGATTADNFENGQVYNGGTGLWTSPWVETDSSGGGASGGSVLVANTKPYAGQWHLALSGNNAITRSLNLSGFSRPQLRFKRLHQVDADTKQWYLDINNGLGWTRVLTWSNNVEEGSYYQPQVDLFPYISTNTTLRFTNSNNLASGDYLYLDEVEIYDAVMVNENQALAIGTYNGHQFNATDSALVYLSALNLQKEVSRATAQINDTLVYTLTYRNSSAITTTHTTLNDVVPLNTTFIGASSGGVYLSAANVVSWTVGNIAPGASGVVTFSVKVNNNTANGTEIENTGRINSDQTGLVNSQLVKTTVQAPVLNLSKTGSAAVSAGEVITYYLAYANPGDAPATGALISDTIPASTTYVLGSLEINTGNGWVPLTNAGQWVGSTLVVRPGIVSGMLNTGESGQIRFAVIVSLATSQGASIGNVARLSSDQLPAFNSNLLSTAVSPLSISQSSDHSLAAPGQPVVFTVAYGNRSSSLTLTNLALVNSLPDYTHLVSGTVAASGMDAIQYSGDHGLTWSNTFTNPLFVTDIRWQRTALPAGQSGAVSFQVMLNDPLAANTTIQNVARITSTQTAGSGWLYANSASIGAIDLTLTKTAHDSFARPGGHITYTLTYGNNGSAAAAGAVISDIIPANTTYVPGSIFGSGADDSDPNQLRWNLSVPANTGGLKAGFVVTVNADVTPGSAIYNIASLTNAYDSVTTAPAQVTAAQDGVTISPNHSDTTHDQSQQVCYGHTIGNTGDLTNTMELTPTHNLWTGAVVSLYKDNNGNHTYDPMDTALSNTNGYAGVDTGQLTPGQQIQILACFTIPSAVNDGDTDTLNIVAATAAGAYSSQVKNLTTVRLENFLTIISPSANLVTNTTSIAYSGATNPNATVVITNTTTGVKYTVTADGLGNFSTVITLTPGSNTLTARSVNLDGYVAADTRTITRVSDPTDSSNNVTIIQPGIGTVTSTSTISVTGSTDPGSVVTVTVGSNVYTTTANSSGNYGLTATLPNLGMNTITVTSTDPFGNPASVSRDVRLTNDLTDSTNTLIITQPAPNAIISTSSISVTGATDPGSVVTVTVGSNVYTTTANSSGNYGLTATLPNLGMNTIIVTSTDPFGNPASASRDVRLTNDLTDSSNTVSIIKPGIGAVTSTSSISVTGATDPGSVVTVTVGSNVYTTTANSSGNYGLTATLPNLGMNTITVTSTDPFGNPASVIRDVRLTNDLTDSSNTVSIIKPGIGAVTSTSTISVTGATDPGSVVTVTVGSNVYTTTANSSGNYGLTATLPLGMNTITVTSTDPFGNPASASRDVRLTNDLTDSTNTLIITQPAPNAIISTAAISVTGATDPGSVVTVTVGSNVYTTTANSSGDYGLTATLPNLGMNTIIVNSTDPFGNPASASRDVRLTNDLTDSTNTLIITQPTPNAIISTAAISVTGATDPGSVVTVTVGSNVYTTTANSSGNYGLSVTLPNLGMNTITVNSTDPFGNPASASRDVRLTNDLTDSTNTLIITQPTPNAIISTAAISVTGATDPGSVVTVTVGSNVYTTTANSSGDYGLTATLPNLGMNTITVNSTDPFGNPASASRDVRLTNDLTDSTNTLIITQPAPNAIISTAAISVTGATDPGSVVTVTVGGNVYTTTANSSGNFSLTITLPTIGANTLVVTSTDLYGNEDSVTRNVLLTQDTTPDSTDVTITFPTPGYITNTTALTVTGTGDPGAVITITIGSAGPFTTTVDASGQFAAPVTLPEVGLNTIEMTAADAYGNTDTASVNVRVYPTVNLDSGAVYTINEDAGAATITVTLSAASNQTITIEYATANGTASAGSDYIASSGVLTFAPGQTVRAFTIPIIADTTDEPDETILVTLSNPAQAYLNTAAVTLTIIDNDVTLTGHVVGDGNIGVSPNQSPFTTGQVVTLTAAANPGWTFDQWSGDVSGSASATTITMDNNKVVTATFSQNYYTLVATAAAGQGWITNSSPTKTVYAYGEVVTLTAVANFGWTFTGWSGDLSGLSASQAITITGNTMATALFTQNVYTLNVTAIGGAVGRSNPAQTTYHYGDVVTLTAAAAPGWTFAGWSGDASGSNNPEAITIIGNMDVAATFSQSEYTLTLTPAGGGVITPSNSAPYHYGDVITLTAAANPGWRFTGWSGNLSGSNPVGAITMTGDLYVTAIFTQEEYTLNVTTAGSGAVTRALSSPTQTIYHYGEVVTLTATADPGWTFTGWSGDLPGSDNPKRVTMTGNKTATANFIPAVNPTTLSLSISALDVNGGALVVNDALRYTMRVTNTGSYLALNVVVTDTMPIPANVTLVGTLTSQGAASGPVQIVWLVGEILPHQSATMVMTVTLTSNSPGQSIINVAVAKADNAAEQSAQICPDNKLPGNDGVCSSKPQEASPPSAGPTRVFLPIIMNNAAGVSSSSANSGQRVAQEVPPPTPAPNADTDNDGMPDSWEAANGLNPNVNDAAADADGDGLTNLEEYLLHLNPQNPDTDGDGINDGVEIGNPNAPADSDGDGIIDALDTDSDNDGISDRQEGAGDTDGDGIPNYRDADSDGDGILDSQEGSSGPADPLGGCTAQNPVCFNNDVDGDGIPNYLDTDSDGDSISDVEEGTADPDHDGIPNYLDTDSDGDTSPDSLEGTRDSDGDGIPDYLDPDTTLTHPEPGLSE